MRVGPVVAHAIAGLAHGDFLEALEIDQCDLGVCLADIDDGDGFHHHLRWKTVLSGTATGSLSARVSMISAIWAHHFRITGCDGRSPIL